MSNTTKILQKQLLFAEFSPQEMNMLGELFTTEKYAPGDFILHENDTCNDLYYLEKGTVQGINKANKSDYILFELQENQFLGELSFIDEKERSSSIQAKTDVVVLRLQKKDLEKLTAEFKYLEHKLLIQLSKVIIDRLRETNKKSVEEMDRKNRLGKFSIIVMIGLSIVTCLTGFIKMIRVYVPIYLVAPIVMTICISLLVKAIQIAQLPFARFGLTWKGTKKAAIEGIFVSLLLAAIGLSFLQQEDLVYAKGILTSNFRAFIYLAVAVVQELLYRGVLQSALEDIYEDKNGYMSILLSSLVFCVSHVYLGLAITICSFFAGILLGFMYKRHQNLVGVVIVHYILGCMAVAFRFIGT